MFAVRPTGQQDGGSIVQDRSTMDGLCHAVLFWKRTWAEVSIIAMTQQHHRQLLVEAVAASFARSLARSPARGRSEMGAETGASE